MRQLTLEEISVRFNDYISDIKHGDFQVVRIKLTQLINFLRSQDISNRILERIDEDYLELKESLVFEKHNRRRKDDEEIIDSLETPELQGAFAYFTIIEKFKVERKITPHYIELSRDWYNIGTDYYEYHHNFNTYFLDPFKELFNWYIYESKAEKEEDFFSKSGRKEMEEKLNEIHDILRKQGENQELISEQIKDLNKLTNSLNKKNWKEIAKTKFIDLAFSHAISPTTANLVFKMITGNDIPYLGE
tara:strand:- start:534 stop:1274 length:741 start_codon:yes stop_codon:yes gene_type:complete